MPDGMRMMVPNDSTRVDRSPLFSASAKQAFTTNRPRLRAPSASAPEADETVASFIRRHFGRRSSPDRRSPARGRLRRRRRDPQRPAPSCRSSLPWSAPRLADRRPSGPRLAHLPAAYLHHPSRRPREPHQDHDRKPSRSPGFAATPRSKPSPTTTGTGASISAPDLQPLDFDQLFLATPPHVTRSLLRPLDPDTSGLLELESTSAIIVALAFPSPQALELPPGFGFLVPPSSDRQLLACTFVDQKFAGRVPSGARLFRAFFGGSPAASPTEHIG